MFGISMPSVSDVTHALGDAAHTAEGAAGSALHTTEDLGGAALSKAGQLARHGADLGRQAVDAASHLSVQGVGNTISHAIGTAETAADKGIQTGVMAAGHTVQHLADDVTSHIHGSGVLSRLARGAVSGVADQTRFDIGVVGGVGKAAVGLAGSAGQLGVLAAEYQYSPSARAAINDKLGGLATSGAKSALSYAASVAENPSRVGGDLASVGRAGAGWVSGEVNSAEQAIKDGHGPESFGMTVGNAATYLIPVGGEARAVAGVGELAVRGLGEATVEDGARTLAETGAKSLAGDGTKTLADGAGGTADKAIPPISDAARAATPEAARRTGLSEAKITEILETPKSARPASESYLSDSYRSEHLSQWNEGAVRFTSRSKFNERGTLGPPGGFAIPASQFKALLKSSGGDLSKVETELGLSPGYLNGPDTMVVRIAPADMHNLRVPSGSELGANENWVPGGYTSGGQPEAALDFPPGTAYTEVQFGKAP